MFNFIYYYFSYSLLVFFLVFVYFAFTNQNKFGKIFYLSVAFLIAVFLYSRFVETNLIKVYAYNLSNSPKYRIVVISDLHIGVYKKQDFLKRVVEKINKIDPDFVLIAGDFIYHPYNLEILNPLSSIKAPVYAVLGNHDNEFGEQAIIEKLKQLKVNILVNEVSKFNDIKIYGLGELWSRNANTDILKSINGEKSIILLHNPDITLSYSKLGANLKNSLTIAGHTHCGQIRIPLLYKFVIPTKGDFSKKHLYDLKENGKLFISCGLGEIGLPVRLFTPPEIVIVNF